MLKISLKIIIYINYLIKYRGEDYKNYYLTI